MWDKPLLCLGNIIRLLVKSSSFVDQSSQYDEGLIARDTQAGMSRMTRRELGQREWSQSLTTASLFGSLILNSLTFRNVVL